LLILLWRHGIGGQQAKARGQRRVCGLGGRAERRNGDGSDDEADRETAFDGNEEDDEREG